METHALVSCQTRGSDGSGRSPDPIMRQPRVDLGEKNEPRGRRTGGRSLERSIDPKAPNREGGPVPDPCLCLRRGESTLINNLLFIQRFICLLLAHPHILPATNDWIMTEFERRADAMARGRPLHSRATSPFHKTGRDRRLPSRVGHATIRSTEIYLRSDPARKLEILGETVPPSISRGAFKDAPDRLMMILREARAPNKW